MQRMLAKMAHPKTWQAANGIKVRACAIVLLYRRLYFCLCLQSVGWQAQEVAGSQPHQGACTGRVLLQHSMRPLAVVVRFAAAEMAHCKASRVVWRRE